MSKSPAAILYDSDGTNPVGTAAHPLRTDPTGSTAQPVSATSLPLPTGAATAVLQTQPGVDIGDVTVNNAAGAAAVNVQDGGNSLTIDATALPLPTGAATASNQTDGSQKSIVRGGAKGTTVAADVTSQNVDADTQALHVKVVGGGSGPGSNVRVVDGSGNPIDTPDEGNPATVNGLMMGGWEESANRLHRIAVDSQGRILTISSGKLGSMIDLYYRNTLGAYVANQFRRVIEYIVPEGYSAYLTRFSTWQNESAYSRAAAETCFATLNVATNVFVAESSYITPQFSSVNEAEVTTQFGAANNVTITVTYTNNLGVTGRTGTLSIPKSSIVGTRATLALQAGDLGVRSVQGMSASPSGGAGAVELCGFIQFAFHFDLSATQGVDTSFATGSISFPAGTIFVVEFNGGTVAKDRILNAQIQLVTV